MLKTTIITWALCMLPLAGGAAQSTGPALTVHFEYQPADLSRVRVLHGRLDKAVRRAGVGEVDEAELHADGNDGYFDMRGPDPERIYRVVAPILRASSLMSGAEITKRAASGKSAFPLH
ncbi:hypothetical protein [Comamonas guangdongensis]|uniref:Uncharacterized protein n=1 Tax=Comamonas guangdongensis TaxID=510515 RepID=A0ABV3ZZ74_9BURK